MNWRNAVKISKVNCAVRKVINEENESEPNIVLIDYAQQPPKAKAFRSSNDIAWNRVNISLVKDYDDWIPAKDKNNYGANF